MADEDDDEPVIDSKDHAGLVRRIEKLVRQNGELKAQLSASAAKLTEHEKAADAVAKATKEAAKVLTERDALLAEKAGWGEERAILGAGITDAEGIDFVRLAYGRIPVDDRPKGGPAEWLKERDKLPKGVQAYLPEIKGETKAAAKPPPPPNTGAKPPPQSNGNGLAAQLASGSLADIRAGYEAMWAELGVAAPPLPKPQG